MHAATTKNAADDGSPGTSSSNASGAPGSTRTEAVDGRHRRAQRGEHALGVIAARDRARRSRSCPSACSPASTSADFTCALATGELVPQPRERAAADDERRAASPSSRPSIARAHRAQRLDDARHRPLAQRRVAGQHRQERAAREHARRARASWCRCCSQSSTPSGSRNAVDARRR